MKYDLTLARRISDEEAQEVQEAIREFEELRTNRASLSNQCEEIAALVMPTFRGTFTTASYQLPGVKKTDRQVDATGMMALVRFAAICDSLLTPRNQTWHQLVANNEYVMKDRATRLWFEDVTRMLFKYRYAPNANYASQNHSVFKMLGAFGTGPMFVDKLDYALHGERGLRYRSVPFGEIYLKTNHQGRVDGYVRHIQMTARQAEQRWPGHLPQMLWPALEKNSVQLFSFIQRVCPRTDNYDPGALDARSMPYRSQYVCIEAKCMMPDADGRLEGGYKSFPLPVARYDEEPGSPYGVSPAMHVLPALKTLNAEKTVFLKQGHRIGDPVLLTHDDGVIPTTRPGSFNPGGMSADGKPLIGVLPTGNIAITKEMMQEERQLINDAFLVSLFQILTESPQMTATEVIERINEKGILLAPTVGQQQSGYLGPKIEREIDLLADMRLLPPMPPRLREARGEYEVIYTSPLAKAMRAGEASGWLRLQQELRETFAITQDPSLFDPLQYDRATPELADIHSVPVRWMASDEEIAQKRQQRAQQQKIQQQIQAAPAAAAMLKARTAAGEAGQPGA